MTDKSKKLKYPIGIQTFEKLIRGGYLYVDKTEYIHDLISSGQYYFLSRPRRFGKSLLLSTIQAYFEGKRELFEGLAISSLENDWTAYPVIRLDFSAYNPNQAGHIEMILDTQLLRYEEKYAVASIQTSYDQRLNRLIHAIYQHTGKGVVVLIDEYDAPLTAHITSPSMLETRRNTLRSLYSNLKSMDEYLRFVMLTGVTRYSKTSVFSGLNNLEDISLDDDYSAICGITEEEIKGVLWPGIEELARKTGTSDEEMMQTLKYNYDGYHFTPDCVDVYNPFSLLQSLKKNKIGMYWYQSGKATIIINLINESPHLLSREQNRQVGENILSEIDVATNSLTALMFQAGYLTIKSWDPATKMVTLGIPNREVKEGLYTDLAMEGLGVGAATLTNYVWDVKSFLMNGEALEAFDRLKAFFGSISYLMTQNRPDIFYENNLFLLLSLIGIDTTAEWHTSEGRIDMILKFPEYVYVIELKLDGSAAEALAQINNNNYSLPFKYEGRKIIKIGISFSSATRNISDIIAEEEK